MATSIMDFGSLGKNRMSRRQVIRVGDVSGGQPIFRKRGGMNEE